MIGDIGKKASEKELEQFCHDWRGRDDKKGIIDYNNKRIILPSEFYTPKGPASLNWKELNYLNKHDDGGGVLVLFPGGFHGLLDSFCQELKGKGLMSEDDICAGDYYLINAGGGIEVRYRDGYDPHGRTAFSRRIYYPRIKEDAEEYAKHFYSEAFYPVYVAQINSVGNREWDISKEASAREDLLIKKLSEKK